MVENESTQYTGGYNIGLNWSHNWEPGGPWFPRSGYRPGDKQFEQLRLKMVADNLDWRRGWKDGYAAKLAGVCNA